MASKVRWALVGTGGIGRRTAGDLRQCETAEIVAVASRSQETADAFAEEWGIEHAFGDYSQLCASAEVDAVYIGTPHSTHFAYAREALSAGKHVLCEKPLTMTSDEARELGRVAAAHGVFLMEAMWMKFSPAMVRAVELIEAGVIGETRFIQAGLGYPVPVDGPPRFWDAALGGGALYDMGVYMVTLAHLFLGKPESISAVGYMRDDGVDLHDAITLEYESGALVQFATSITSFMPPRGWIGGAKGSIDFGERLFSPESMRVTTGTPPVPPTVEDLVFAQEGAGYVPMFRAVNERILAGETEHPLHPISATVDVLETMELIRQRMAEGRDARREASFAAGAP